MQTEVSVPVRVNEVARKTIRNTLTVNGTVSPTGTSEVKTKQKVNTVCNAILVQEAHIKWGTG
jgi:multidrug efflux pump subunit AcrA (membrane-fusion protein)